MKSGLRRDRKNIPKKTVSDPTQGETLELNRKEKPIRADEPVTEFKAKLNKWGFIHVPKRTVPSLPFKIEKPLTARIDGKMLVIAVVTKKST